MGEKIVKWGWELVGAYTRPREEVVIGKLVKFH